MNNLLYTLYFIALGTLSFFTGEIVTFIMLGIILISLTNISVTLKEILKVQKQKSKYFREARIIVE
ncbi:hypothetical protein [Oceanobacillus massiliensis]|uniref:hypothetical protein n=1 Tax=Oceanobacillus massiliensis TaxID=1465765 RepID=UPI000288748D|nr:hypothetical protein [Oceanobacillus massiliensis]